jgi:hypothetical protein
MDQLIVSRCIVIGCTAPSVANGVCRKHYMRLKRHGTTEQSRAKDWGARETHPLYKLWGTIKRFRSDVVCTEWLTDFWRFVADVKERPSGANKMVRLERQDDSQKLGPGNFYWAIPKLRRDELQSRAAYMKEWRQKQLEANEDYFRDADYQKRYGVSLEWYNQKLAEQGGNCAIHGGPETTRIKGKVIRLAVDHCHITGKARGLLCKECNGAIGQLHHDPARATAAAEYLTFHAPHQAIRAEMSGQPP